MSCYRPTLLELRDGRKWPRVLVMLVALGSLGSRAEAQRRPRVAEVSVAPSDAQAKVGERQPFMAIAYDASGNPVETAVFTWVSSNTAIATVDQNGIATGVGGGTAIITARTGSGAAAKMGQATITVAAPPAPVVPQGAAGQVAAPAARPDSAARITGAGARPPVAPAAGAVAPKDTMPRAPAPVLLGPGSAALAKQPDGTGPADSLIVEPTSVRLPRGGSRELLYHTIRGNRQNAEKVPIVFTVGAGGERIIRVDSVGTITAVGDTGRTTLLIVVPTKSNIPPVVVAVQVGDTAAAAAAPAPAKGYLTVNAIPYATLSIDGVEIGDTPIVNKELAPGNHTVRLVRDGYKTETFTVKVEPGSPTRVSRTLVREN